MWHDAQVSAARVKPFRTTIGLVAAMTGLAADGAVRVATAAAYTHLGMQEPQRRAGELPFA